MANLPPPSGQDPANDPVVIGTVAGLLAVVALYFVFYFFEQQIVGFIFFLTLIVMAPHKWLATHLPWLKTSFYTALQSGDVPLEYGWGMYMLWRINLFYLPIVLPLLMWLGWRAFFSNSGNLTKGALGQREIWAINAYNFSSSIPAYGRNIEEQPRFSGPWRLAFSAPLYCARYGILQIRNANQAWENYPFEVDDSGRLERAVYLTLPGKEKDLRINTHLLAHRLKEDLGETNEGLSAMFKASPVYLTLSYIFIGWIVFGRRYGYQCQDRINRIFADITPATRLYPVPKIKPLPLTIEHLQQFVGKEKLEDETFEFIGLNQLRLAHLERQAGALKAYLQLPVQEQTKDNWHPPKKLAALADLEKKFAKEAAGSPVHCESFDVSAGAGRDWAEKQLERLNSLRSRMVDLKTLSDNHGFFKTVLYRLFHQASRHGVLTSADFLWLRPMMPSLFMALNNLGRETAALIDGAAVHYHALCEMRAGARLVEPDFTALIEGVISEVHEYFGIESEVT